VNTAQKMVTQLLLLANATLGFDKGHKIAQSKNRRIDKYNGCYYKPQFFTPRL
jgi:hypothetical protein